MSPASPTLAGGFFITEQPGKLMLSMFLSIYPEEELLDHTVVLFLIWGGPSIPFSTSNCTILHFHQQCLRVQFLHIVANTYFLFIYFFFLTLTLLLGMR